MKKYNLFLIIIVLFSCKKNDTDIFLDNRCTNYSINDVNHTLLPDKEIDTIKYLFRKNNLGSTNLQFSELYKHDDSKAVFCNQYVNNLKVFIYILGFRFNESDSLTSSSGQKITGIDLPNTPRLSNSYVRGVFVNELGKGDFLIFSDSINEVIANGCINIEFGYFDLNISQYMQYKFTPAWHVQPVGLYSLKEAYIDDLTGKKILF
jgi:hypothetical protein